MLMHALWSTEMQRVRERFEEDSRWKMDIQSDTFFVLSHQQNKLVVECSLESEWSEQLATDQHPYVMVMKRSTKDAKGDEQFLDYVLTFFLPDGRKGQIRVELIVQYQLQTNTRVELHAKVPNPAGLIEDLEPLRKGFEKLIKEDHRYRLHFTVHDAPFVMQLVE